MIGNMLRVLMVMWMNAWAVRSIGNCRANNTLIERLMSQNVVIFSFPQKPKSATCDREWSANKTCCDVSSLVKYAAKDKRKIQNSVESVMLNLYLISRHINCTLTIAQSLKDFNLNLSPLLTAYDSVYHSEPLASFRAIHNKVLNSFQSINASSQVCWDYLSKIRSLSLCSVCSGRREVFFRYSKALISFSTCSDIMKKCGDHFGLLVKFVKRSSQLAETLYDGISNGSFKVYPSTESAINRTRGNLTQIISNPTIRSLMVYLENINSTTDQDAMIRCCKKLSNLVMPTFIQKIRPLMNMVLESNGMTGIFARSFLDRTLLNKTQQLVEPETADQIKEINKNLKYTSDPLDAYFWQHRKAIRDAMKDKIEDADESSSRRLQASSNFVLHSKLPGIFDGDVQVFRHNTHISETNIVQTSGPILSIGGALQTPMTLNVAELFP